MSRCFPYPPPGYERSNHLDSLAEEKRKEKKHKKEKRDKEKREGKEKKEKDRSKDKHKEKKERKEKHKDKKKKDKDKDKSRTPNDRPDKQSQFLQGDVLGECSRKTEDIKHSKFTEEFDRRVKDDEKVATNRKVDNFNGPVQKNIGSLGAATTVVKERATNDKIVPPSMGASQRRIDDLERTPDKFSTPTQRKNEGLVSTNAVQKERNSSDKLLPKLVNTGKRGNGGMPLPIANSMGTLHRGPEGPSSANTVQKERSSSDKLLPKLIHTGQRGNGGISPMENSAGPLHRGSEGPSAATSEIDNYKSNKVASNSIKAMQRQRGNGGISLPMENSAGSLHRGSEGPSPTAAVENDNYKSNKVASNSNKAVQRTINGMGQSAQSLSSHKHVNSSFSLFNKMEDREEANRSISSHDDLAAKKIDGAGWPVEKVTDNRSEEGKAKSKEGEGEVRREERYKDRDHDRKKVKDKDKHKGKEKEKAKVKEKGEQKHKAQNEPKDGKNKGQLDSLKPKPLVPDADIAKNNLIDGNTKKRKEIDINGFLNENNLRPNKVPKTNSSTHLREENGRTLESYHVASAFPPVKPEAANNALPKKAVDRKEHVTNGITEAQPSSSGLTHPVAAEIDATATGKVRKSPHPDSMYLDQIYAIPKVDEWQEEDDQEWLFSNCHLLQKPKPNLLGDEVPQVWSRALRIESEDVLALPYVVPF
ncbi:Myb-like protein X [Canna indica]|uniref:Myb-like protein X n=1 Tax=Canna indica TaxID=4628 RepID=A0AAQ3Q4T1_9LILI|nr:Myb-like protein X [Canna indica]